MGLVSALRKLESASRAVPLDAEPGHRAHVHHQALVRFRFDGDVQHASANWSARAGALGHALAASRGPGRRTSAEFGPVVASVLKQLFGDNLLPLNCFPLGKGASHRT